MRPWLGVLFLAACELPTGIAVTDITVMPHTAVTDAAARQAYSCGFSHHKWPRRSYGSLHLYLVRGDSATDFGIINGAGDRVEGLNRGSSIWVTTIHRDDQWMWAHEMLHAIFDVTGTTAANHDPIFAACGL